MNDLRVCAVIPAAGRGTRLGLDTPKIMLEVADGVTVWHLLYRRLRPWVEHVHVVVSPTGEPLFRHLAADEIRSGEVSVSVQEEPNGMGAAIFGAAGYWETYDAVLVVWGDQVNVSPVTVRRVLHGHREVGSAGGPGLTVALVPMPEPYVEYEVGGAGSSGRGSGGGGLLRVRMSREGDVCRPGGLSDVGVFCLSTAGLRSAWTRYLTEAVAGAVTGEVNFIPFLPYLSQVYGWRSTVVPVTDPDEARGINTREDLDFARQALRRWPT